MFEQFTSEANLHVRSLLGSDVSIQFAIPDKSEHGDLMTTVALQLAKARKQNPREIAQELASALGQLSSVEKAEVAGAGYVNLWLKPEALLEELKNTRTALSPKKASKKAAPVIIEGSDPNIAKPLGIHHILPTMIGQSLVNLYRHAGYTVIAWNYIGDWGTQFGNLSVAVEKWGSGKPTAEYSLDELLALYVKFHEELERSPELEEEGRKAFRLLEKGDKTQRAFWSDVVAITKTALVPLFERLHVAYDLELGESFYNDKMDTVIEEGISKGVFKEGKEGALIAEFEDPNMPPYVIRKGDGATLYSTRDIAQMRYRLDTYHPQEILIPTDISQKLHFEQLIGVCEQLQWELPAFENVLFGRMRFADKAMSTRKGNIVKLEEVLDEAVNRAEKIISERGDAIQTDDPGELAEIMGIGAVVYGVLSQNRKMDIVFDWDKMLSFEGNSAPYLQYTHARAKSVLRKAELKKEPALPKAIASFEARERSLIHMLLKFPTVLEEARAEHLPHKLTNYLYALCQEFNAFYNAEPILQAPEPTRTLRLFLTSLTASVLKTGAELLTLRVPERM